MAQEQSANPFRPGNGVLPAYLAGREKPLAEFDAFVADPQPIYANWTVTGLRGTGKTVLVETAAARAEAAGWLTLQRELGERHRDDAVLADAIDEDVDAHCVGAVLLLPSGNRSPAAPGCFGLPTLPSAASRSGPSP